MKKYFITGLIILLPLALTVSIIAFFVNLLTDPFIGLSRSVLSYFNLLEKGVLFFSAEEIQYYASKILILIVLVTLTVCLGALARWYFFHALLRLWDYTLQSIPLVRTIYKTSQDIINTIFANKTESFKQVVLVPFPTATGRSIGFVTQSGSQNPDGSLDSHLITVFVPTTPNPTSGFLMMFPEADLIHLDMKVEDAFKYVISCGVVNTSLKEREKDLNPLSKENV